MAHSDGRDRHRVLLEGYERRRREVSEHTVLDAAEDVLGHAWVAELDRERRASVTALEIAAEVVVAARRLLSIAESEGDRAQVHSARALHAQAEKDLAQTFAETQATLSRVDRQLHAIGDAALARLRRRRSDTERLRAARRAMGGEAPG
jgi:hypothetical protein